MAPRGIRPTTKAQVSGHRFLKRRVEHGLLFGDIRMIHDPLAARRRGAFFGIVATVLVSLGAGLMAWISPDQDPGDAVILADSRQQLYVSIDGVVHPVENLTSAQLIAGRPDKPTKIGDAHLAQRTHGVPVGIAGAPGVVAEHAPEGWSVCFEPTEASLTVVAGPTTQPSTRAALLENRGQQWLLTAEGRFLLPPVDEPLGRVIRRVIGITADTPVVEMPGEVISSAVEQPRFQEPLLRGEILDAGEDAWMLAQGEVLSLIPAQREILEGLGWEARKVDPGEIAQYPDASQPLHLPDKPYTFIDTACISEGGLSIAPSELNPVELSGDSLAGYFSTTVGAAVAVETGNGAFIVSADGRRYAISREDLSVLGVAEPAIAPWEILRLLPAGPDISLKNALEATY